MNLLGCLIVILLFVFLIRRLNLVAYVHEVTARSRDAATIFRDPNLSDDEKEARMQKHSLRLLVLFVILVTGSAVALFAPIGVIWLLDLAGLFSLDGVLHTLMRWDFIAATTVLGIAVYFIVKRLRA